MSSQQITGLPAAISLNGQEQLEAVQAGTSVRATVNQIANFAAQSTLIPAGGTTSQFLIKSSDTDYAMQWHTLVYQDVGGLGTAATESTGTSGHLIPFLDGNNIYSGSTVMSGSFATTENSINASSASLSIDLSAGNTFAVTLNANLTSVAFINWPLSGRAQRVVVYFIQGATPRTVTGWSSVKWAGGAPPTITASGGATDCLVFDSFDNGATIFGNVAGQAYS